MCTVQIVHKIDIARFEVNVYIINEFILIICKTRDYSGILL